MEEEEEKKIMAEVLQDKVESEFFQNTNFPIKISASPERIRADFADSQNLTLLAPNEERDASAIIEKEIDLDKNMRALVAHELRKGGKEGTGLQLETPNFNIRGSTDWNNEELASISGRIKTPVGTIGGRYNTNFAKGTNGEIYWLSPNGRWNATGSTNLEDVKKLNLEYNADKFNIGLDMNSMGEENLRGQWNPTENLSIGGGLDFDGSRNISAKGTVPISKNWVVDALLGRRENKYEDENEVLFNLRRRFNN